MTSPEPIMSIYAGGGGRVKVVEWNIGDRRKERVIWLSATDALEIYRQIIARGYEEEVFATLAESVRTT